MTTTEASGDELVTGEAVVVDLPDAGLGLRIVSGGIDVVARALALALLVWLAATVADALRLELDAALWAGVGVVTSVGVLVGWPTLEEYATGGLTLGKRIAGLRTVRDDGGPADPRRYLARHLVGVVEVWGLGGAPALLTGLVTRRTKRLGDLVAGTVVARDRRRLSAPAPVPMPTSLETWAGHTQVGELPADLVTRARHFLRYGAQLDPDVRTRDGARLADALAARVAPPPPPDARPEDVVRAVLARRRVIDEARLAREEALATRLFGVSATGPHHAASE